MGDNSKIRFETEFLDILMAAQEESIRLGLQKIYDIIIVKSLIYFSGNLKDFFQYTDLSWTKVKDAIKYQLEMYLEENKEETNNESSEESEKEKAKVYESSIIDWGTIHNLVCISTEVEETIANCIMYSYTGDTIGEIEYLLSLLETSHNSYVEGFFRLINLDTRLLIRYLKGTLEDKETAFTDDESYDEEDDEEDDVCSENFPKNGTTESEKDEDIVIIPSVQSFLDFVYVDKTKPSPIRGRDRETMAIIQVLLKSKKSNAVLVGQPGVGKTAIVEHLTWLIETKNCPEELTGKRVISLDVNALIAGAKYVGMAEKRFTALSNFLKNQKNVILFIDEMHTIVGAGACEDNTLDLGNALKPMLARGEIKVIGTTTEAEYQNWMSKDKALKRRFEKIEIREPEFAEVYPMVKQQVSNLEEFHNVKIDKKVLDYIIKVAGCFNTETANPDRTLDMVDRAMVSAKLKGKKTVTMNVVMSILDANFKKYQEMSKELKLQTAYHELGHYLVRRYSKNLSVEKALAISIIPAEDYLGITVSNGDNNLIINWTYETHLERIAISLGGRVAEKMLCSTYSSGAWEDLKRATEEAKKMILEYGFASEFSERNVEHDRTEKQTEQLNEQIDKIIAEGYELAEKILKEHKDVLKELAKILCNKGILVGNDLEAICRKVEKRGSQ